METPRKVRNCWNNSPFPFIFTWRLIPLGAPGWLALFRFARLSWMCSRIPPSLSAARRSSPPRMYSLSLSRHFKKKMTHWHFPFQQTPRCTQTSEESHITESIASTDTVKIEEGVPVDAQTLGRASNVLHRQKAKLISKSNLISKARFQQTGVWPQGDWQEGGRCRRPPWHHLHHPLQHPHLQTCQDGLSFVIFSLHVKRPTGQKRWFLKQVGHPDCVSVPVKQCENIPNSNKRNVARTVCDTVVDSHEVEVGVQLEPLANVELWFARWWLVEYKIIDVNQVFLHDFAPCLFQYLFSKKILQFILKIVLFVDGDDGDDGDGDDDDDDDCRMISLLIQDCTETITEVCEQTNTYSHTTVYRQRYQKYYL